MPSMSSLGEWYKWARPYDAVVVCGVQRSGTQIAARILCAESGRQFVSYQTCRVSLDGLDLLRVLMGQDKICWHHPDALALAPFLVRDERIGVTIIDRATRDVLASRRRIEYTGTEMECWYLGVPPPATDQLAICTTRRRVRAWVTHKAIAVVPYATLAAHELFVAERNNWATHQWQEGQSE